MTKSDQFLHEGQWDYAFKVINKISAILIQGSKSYIQEEEMILSELMKFIELSRPIKNALEKNQVDPESLRIFFDTFENKAALSTFYFAAYQKLRNRLKFELLFFDKERALDIEKCKAYLNFNKRLDHNVKIVLALLAGKADEEFITLEKFIQFCSLLKTTLPVYYLRSIDEHIVDLRINIYETKEKIEDMKAMEPFRTNRISELECLVKDYISTAEFYEREVITGEYLGCFYIKDFVLKY